MSERPAWSGLGFRRKVEMSPHSFHIVVEGKSLDAAFYGRVAEHCSATNMNGYEVTPIHTLRVGDGKTAVLNLFAEMRDLGHLIQHTSTGARIMMFFVDRDAERVLGGSVDDPHVVYTEGYDVENDIFWNGSDALALSSAISAAPNRARQIALRLEAWQTDASLEWKEWIILCLLAKLVRASTVATFGHRQVPDLRSLDLALIRMQIEAKSGLSASQFADVRVWIETQVDNIYRVGKGHVLVKGKWLPHYLKSRIEKHNPPPCEFDTNGFETRAANCYVSVLDMSKPWFARYDAALEERWLVGNVVWS